MWIIWEDQQEENLDKAEKEDETGAARAFVI